MIDFRSTVIGLTAAVLLAGCGGGSSNSGSSSSGDPFIADVSAVIATPNPNQQQPVSTSGVQPTQNNTAQPQTLP